MWESSMLLSPMAPDQSYILWNMDLSNILYIFSIANKLSLVFFLLAAWWLYMINKKLWEKYPWLSFIPLVQLYNYWTASQKSLVIYILYPILALIIWGILSIFTFWITWIIALIYFMVMIVKLYHAISVRCGGWAWTTLWFLFIWFIMFPIVWFNLEDKSWKVDDSNSWNTIVPNENIIIENKKVEL